MGGICSGARIARRVEREAYNATRDTLAPIIGGFREVEAERIFLRQPSRRYGGLSRVILRKLLEIEAAITIDKLRSPPGNRLEALSGNRKGQHSIRVNDQ